MKSGLEIPPWVAVGVIVLVVVVVGFFVWRGTGKKTMSVSDREKMMEMMKKQGMTLAGDRPAGAAQGTPGRPR